MQKKINIVKNEDLVWSVVNKVLLKVNNKYFYEGLEEDLFQEGYVGLLEALERYDSSVAEFSTYAYRYVYGYCLNFLKKELISLRNVDIENSPKVSEKCYDINSILEIDLINEINNRLRVTNTKISDEEANILEDRLLKDYSLEKCAKLNNCSTKKINNVVNKYKELIKDILIN